MSNGAKLNDATVARAPQANIIAGLKNRQLGFENSMRILNSESVLKKKEVCA